MKSSFQFVVTLAVSVFFASASNAKPDIDTFNKYNPIDDYIGVAQQGGKNSSVYVSCDIHIKDCPVRTIKHKASNVVKQDRIVLSAEPEKTQ